MDLNRVRILIDGRRWHTVATAAAAYDRAPDTMRKLLHRATFAEAETDELDARTPVWLATAVTRELRSRPGRGANLRKPQRAAEPAAPTPTKIRKKTQGSREA